MTFPTRAFVEPVAPVPSSPVPCIAPRTVSNADAPTLRKPVHGDQRPGCSQEVDGRSIPSSTSTCQRERSGTGGSGCSSCSLLVISSDGTTGNRARSSLITAQYFGHVRKHPKELRGAIDVHFDSQISLATESSTSYEFHVFDSLYRGFAILHTFCGIPSGST
jgi:hypothetical protein